MIRLAMILTLSSCAAAPAMAEPCTDNRIEHMRDEWSSSYNVQLRAKAYGTEEQKRKASDRVATVANDLAACFIDKEL